MHRAPEANEKPPLRWLFGALSSVTESVSKTVLYFRVANRVGGNGRFLRGFPMWELLDSTGKFGIVGTVPTADRPLRFSRHNDFLGGSFAAA